jgi:uncharacterized protein (UPF0335 family)
MSDDVLNSAACSRLRSIVERIERLEEDKAAVSNDLKEVFAEATGEGFDAKILRKVVRLRKQDKAKRQEEEALLDLYLHAIEGAPVEDTRITIEFPGVAPIHTTSAQLAAALDEDKTPARRRAKRSAGKATVQWRDDQAAPPADDEAQVYRSGPRRGFR